MYRFPAPTNFAGQSWLNPYAELHGQWWRANLHAHGRAWLGLTNGRQSDEAVINHYRDLGYSIPGLSNYQRITTYDEATVPIYEHGYSAGKRHQLAVGARRVDWFDFLLWQSTSNQQYVIDRIKRDAELVALAHPNSRHAYSDDDLRQLTGYDLIEVGNGQFSAENAWDAALSSGHAIWAVADDDTHDITDPGRTGVGWNMIDAASPFRDDVIQALKAGRTYAVVRTGPVDSARVLTQADIPTLASVTVQNGTLQVACTGPAATFTFIGQDGAVRKTVSQARSASYTFTDRDTYVRTQVASAHSTVYLNPVLRYDGVSVPKLRASVDLFGTWLFRGTAALVCLPLLGHWLRKGYTSRRIPREVVADSMRKIA